MKILFIPGTWMSKAITDDIRSNNPGVDVAEVIGLTTEERIREISGHIRLAENHGGYDMIIAYSGGTIVLSEIERRGVITSDKTKVVYMAPGPINGVKFKLKDKAFGIIARYTPEIITHKRTALSIEDFRDMFQGEGEVESVIRKLEPDSRSFLMGQIIRQYKFKKAMPLRRNRFAICSQADFVLGSTQEKTIELLTPVNVFDAKIGGHLGPVFDLPNIIQHISSL